MATLVPASNAQQCTTTSRTFTESDGGWFPLFVSLPPELRLMIWAFNLPGPRLVDVNYVPETGEFYTTTISPVNLRTCRESRREAWRHWGLHFGTCGFPPLIRANLDIDTIQLDWFPIRLGLVDKLDVSRIRYLEIGDRDLQREQENNPRIHSLPNPRLRLILRLLAFPNLEVVTMISPRPARLVPPPNGHPIPWQCIAHYSEFQRRRNLTYSHHLKLALALKEVEGTPLVQGRKIPLLNLVLTDENGARFGPYVCLSR